MKTYLISVVCSDATTYSQKREFATRKEADAFADGVTDLFQTQGKSNYTKTVKISKY